MPLILEKELIPDKASLTFLPKKVSVEGSEQVKEWLEKDSSRTTFTWDANAAWDTNRSEPIRWGWWKDPDQNWSVAKLSREIFNQANVPLDRSFSFQGTNAWLYGDDDLYKIANNSSTESD